MDNLPPTSYAALYDAGQVRLAELGAQLVAYEREGLPTDGPEARLFDLHHKLEQLARTSLLHESLILRAYLQETYGLLAVAQDPFLQQLLPVIPAGGFVLVPQLLCIANRPLLINGRAITLGGSLRSVPLI